MKKKSVALFLIPLFVLTACGGENEEKYAQAAPQDSYASVVEQFLKDPSGNNTKSVLLNAKQYTDYFLYESNLEEARI